MIRSLRFACPRAWSLVVPLVPLVLFAGCRSSSSSRNYGESGGGCCRGSTPNNPPAIANRVSTPVVDFTPAASKSRNASAATYSSPSSTSASPEGLYGGQISCPVTGEPLGSMGTPIPVTVKGQTIYVCCRGCVAKVQADPNGYLRKVSAQRGGQSRGTSSPSSSFSQSNSSLRGSGGSCCHSGGGESRGGGCCGHGGGGCCGR